jgi:hypothetical protein
MITRFYILSNSTTKFPRTCASKPSIFPFKDFLVCCFFGNSIISTIGVKDFASHSIIIVPNFEANSRVGFVENLVNSLAPQEVIPCHHNSSFLPIMS